MLYFWIIFNIFVVGMLVLDMRVFHGRKRTVGLRGALAWSAFYVALAAAFAGILYFWQGQQIALEFVTGYVLELSLSVDNLFVFLVIFNYFSVPEEHQHGVLFWGIIGALVFRGVFIGAGVGLIHHFHWVLYIFGAFLVISGIRLAFQGNRKVDPAANPLVKAVRRLLPITTEYHGGKFFLRNPENKNLLYGTPLLVVLLMIETTDILFAVDSIPAILAVTLNAFVVYTSNVFAILGLRSLYFAVAGLMKIFRFLHYGLALVLVLVGLKMLAASRYHVRTEVTLGSIALVLLISVLASVAFPGAAKE
ncbi:MAG TPA: TerC family protein [Candidatus Acidoferrum sp.]|nr:TerC family protein [Candidatus Acidoferrum sp.]